MKPQEKYPYHQTVHCPNIIFYRIGRDSFYIDSNCVLATDKTITKGKEYVIFDHCRDTVIIISDVILVTCYNREGIITLIVRDIKSKRVSTIRQRIECRESDCKWVLFDINYFTDRMNIKAIQSYCGCGNDPKKKPQTEINHNSNKHDLLEFEF